MAIVYLKASEDVMRTHMLGRAASENRIDDNVETHKKRCKDFEQKSKEIIDHIEYRNKCKTVRYSTNDVVALI